MMYILMHLVFIIWSPKVLSSNVKPSYYGSLSMQNHSSNRVPRSADLNEEKYTSKICLSKCCPHNQIFSYKNRTCFPAPTELSAVINKKWTDDFQQFNVLENFSCPRQFVGTIILNKSSIHYQLNNNGILHQRLRFSEYTAYNRSTFCFEYIWEDATFMPMVCWDGLFDDREDERRRFSAYACGMGLSNFFLVITLALYLTTPALHRSVKNKSLTCYVLSLTLGFSFLMAAQNIHKVNAFCTVIAYMTQFWLLARFFWLNVMCIDIRYAVKSTKLIAQSSKRRFTLYCWYAWGCPMLVSVVTVLVERLSTSDIWKSGLGEEDCWFRKYEGVFLLDPIFLYFYSVISVTLIINLYLFSDTALVIFHKNKKWKRENPDSQRHKQEQKRFLFHLKLFIVMGLNWILDVASYYADSNSMPTFWFIIDVINCSQGVFIFSIFVCNKKVIRLLERRFFPRRTFLKENRSFMSNRTLISSSRRSRTSSADFSLQERTRILILPPNKI